MSARKKVDMDRSSSPGSLSEGLSSGDEDQQLKRIFAEQILDCEMIDVLPATPAQPERPSTRASSVASSSAQMTPNRKDTRFGGGDGASTTSSPSKSTRRKKVSEREICRALGFDIDEKELKEMEKDDRMPVDNILDDILNTGLGKGPRKKGARGRNKEEEKLIQQYEKLERKGPLEISTEGRVTLLKEDVQTVRNTKNAVDALIAVLERTKDKLINEDPSLVYTEPPHVTITNKEGRARPGAADFKKTQAGEAN